MKREPELLTMHADDAAPTDGYGERFYDRQDEYDAKARHRDGVVYTPVACVDFINASVAALLKRHFGVEMNDARVEVVDPFAGTGIFVSRAIENGLVDPSGQRVTQIELSPESAQRAADNAVESMRLSGVDGRVETVCADTFVLDPGTLEPRE